MGIRLGWFTSLLVVFSCGIAFAAPSVTNFTDNKSSYPNSAIPKYEKYEATFQISELGTPFSSFNPFNPNVNALGSQYYNLKGILVDAKLTSPTGRSITWPAFWYESSSGATSWKFRFAPTEVGTWKYRIYIEYGTYKVTSQEYTFTCVASNNRGFVRINPNDRRFFQYSDGTPFYPIGANISGYSSTGGLSAWEQCFPKMKANGGNYSRVFFTSLNIEPYNVGSNKAAEKNLNRYSMGRARTIDDIFECARQNGVYLEWCIDDETYIKDASNQYIRTSGRDAPAANKSEFFSKSESKEIYKRKLRYWMARWGYSVNLLNIELINEVNEAGSSVTRNWHIEMGDYLHTYTEQPHLVSSSNGSGELRGSNGVPYDDEAMDYANYHDYAKYTQSWTIKSSVSAFETLGCTLQYPWQDFAVYVDRLARLHYKRYNWQKPIIWSEFGLIYRRPGDSGFPDWTAAYQHDTSAHHMKDAIWAGVFCGVGVTHWKLNYMLGTYGGGDKFWTFKPVANYLVGENLQGLVQETTYPVSDPLNSSPKVTTSNNKLMVISMRGPNKAYLYVKNLTDTWFHSYYHGTSDHYADSSKIPTPSNQSGTIKVYGMTPGVYRLERWSTSDTNPSTQMQSSTNITVGSDGIATVNVSNCACDQAFKIKPASAPAQPPSVTLTLSTDKTQAAPGTTVTYTVTYTNSGVGPATNTVISVPLPSDTTFVSATSGGTYNSSTKKISWTIPSIAAGATGTVTFQARIN